MSPKASLAAFYIGVLAVAAVVAAGAFTGCGSNEVRSSSQALEFIGDAAVGNVSKWDGLADDASQEAASAWEHQDTIERLGRQLEDHGADWSCTAAELVRDVRAVNKTGVLATEDREEIVESVYRETTLDEVSRLIYDVWGLPPFEATEAIDAVCSIDG